MQVYHQTGKLSKLLENETEVPTALVHIWEAFFLLSARREYDSMNGDVKPINFREIKAFVDVYQPLTAREVKFLLLMDSVYLEIYNGSGTTTNSD